jgi:hypothetical protein
MVPSKNAAAGTASIQNIQRQVGAPFQKIALAPPARLARMSLLKKAQNSPVTIAICWSEARRPRMCAGATSAMYIGANTLAAPIAMPPAILAAMKTPAELAAPVATALAKKRIAFKSIVGRRPIESASVPAPKAPAAQPSKTEATAKPVPAAWVPNAFARASTAPLMTPLSKPKRKPPIAATLESAIT